MTKKSFVAEVTFKLLFILKAHILGSEDRCFTVTLAPKLKTLLS